MHFILQDIFLKLCRALTKTNEIRGDGEMPEHLPHFYTLHISPFFFGSYRFSHKSAVPWIRRIIKNSLKFCSILFNRNYITSIR